MIKIKEYGLCFEGNLINDTCKISKVSICPIETPDTFVTYCSLTDTIKGLLKETGKRMKMYAHDLSYTGEYIKSQLDLMGLVDVTGTDSQASNSFNYIRNEASGFFRFHIVYGGKTIDIIDSKKMAPISIGDIAETLEITAGDYTTLNLTCVCSMVKLLQSEGMKKGTIGSSCVDFFKKTVIGFPIWWPQLFPDLTKIESENKDFKSVDEYVRKSYRGGLCYVNPAIQDQIVKDGTTIDRNAMYSSEMHSKSGNAYPYGVPQYVNDARKLKAYLNSKSYYCFIYLTCDALKLKTNRIPSVKYIIDGYFCRDEFATEVNWNKKDVRYIGKKRLNPRFVMTEYDYRRFIEDYDIKGLQIIDAYVFNTVKGVFDKYIDYFQAKKQNAKTKGERKVAKLALNNLTGKLGAKAKLRGICSNGTYEKEQKTLHVAAGSAVTSYARQNLIDTIYNIGFDKFCYCDTDSVHFMGHDTKDIFIDGKELGAWKVENTFYEARYIKSKIYIEHTTDGYEVTWAGLYKDGIDYMQDEFKKGIKHIDDERIIPTYDLVKEMTATGYVYKSR